MTPDQRRALAVLSRTPRGMTKAALIYGHGFTADLLAELVSDGFATATPGTVRAGGRPIEVIRIKITDAGRDAPNNR